MKNAKSFKHLLHIAILASSTCVLLSGCDKGDAEISFSISDSSITLIEGGASHKLSIYKNEELYLGQISWSSSDETYATVYQGIVKPYREGEVVISAKMGSNILKCNVVVNPNLVSDIESTNVFSGSGDFCVDLTQAEMPSGATFEVVDCLDSLGTSLQNKLYKNGNKTFLKNSVSDKLSEGNYYVNYKITTTRTSANGQKLITVKPFAQYKDLFIIDPIKKDEHIVGLSANQDFMVNAEKYRENVGDFVEYNDESNSAFTSENNYDENKAELLSGLTESGYKGYFANNEVDGYNTTFRMLCKKFNPTSSPRPFFFMKLDYSSNPIWTNLDQFESGTYIDIWIRCMHKGFEDDNFEYISTGWMYTYKGMNDKDHYIENCSSFASTYNSQFGWSKYRISVPLASNYLSGAKHLSLGFEINYGLPGDYLFEIYSVEVTGVSDTVFAPNKTFSEKLVGSYSNVFDSYEYQIKNLKTSTLLNANSDYSVENGKVKLNVDKGIYEIKYIGKKENNSVFETSKTIYNGFINNLASESEISKSAWLPGTSCGFIANPSIGYPEGAIEENGVCYGYTQFIAGRGIFSFNVGSLLSDISSVDNSKKLVISAYFTHNLVMDMSFYLSVGAPHTGNATPSSGNTIYYNGDYGGCPMNTREKVVNSWSEIEIPVSLIKSQMATRPDVNPDNLSIEFRYGEGVIDYIYFYDIVLK